MVRQTLYWHDYETFGTDPKRDRPVQFAGVRTDHDFNRIDEPLVVYCRPADDYLPHPAACAITGITPQQAQAEGRCEAEFIRIIEEQIARPNTCTLGYNNLRFDDEVTRNTLYRNLYDPYQREWRNGNSRWDLIDVIRAAWALRPEGIEWPVDAEGVPVFRLEELTRANRIEHLAAHDALSDVLATIAMAKRVKTAQPRLYQFLFQHRGKSAAFELLQLGQFEPVVHVSGKYPARRHHLAIVLPLCRHPDNSNGIIVYDLATKPDALLSLTAEQIKQRLFTPSEQLPEGVTRIPLKTVHLNKCPVLAPIRVIRRQDEERLNIDLQTCYRHKAALQTAEDLTEKIGQVFTGDGFEPVSDPDLMIYSGGFFNDDDKRKMALIHRTSPEQLNRLKLDFDDPRLSEMFFRYRARNYPDALSVSEREQWYQYCRRKLTDPNGGRGFADFCSELQQLQADPSVDRKVLSDLKQFGAEKMTRLAISQ